jgi:hypothetical protein
MGVELCKAVGNLGGRFLSSLRIPYSTIYTHLHYFKMLNVSFFIHKRVSWSPSLAAYILLLFFWLYERERERRRKIFLPTHWTDILRLAMPLAVMNRFAFFPHIHVRFSVIGKWKVSSCSSLLQLSRQKDIWNIPRVQSKWTSLFLRITARQRSIHNMIMIHVWFITRSVELWDDHITILLVDCKVKTYCHWRIIWTDQVLQEGWSNPSIAILTAAT